MARRNLRVLLLSLLVCLVCAPKASRSTRILWYAMHQIESRYLAPIEERQLFEGAMTGMTMTLDDYSTYIAPAILEDFNEQIDREFGGVGIEIRVDSRTKYLTVASPLVDTPAHASGIRAGDRIERIDDESTQGLSIEDAAERLRGRPGEPVTLTILPKGAKQARDVRLVRAVIHIDTVVGDTRAADGSYRTTAKPELGTYISVDPRLNIPTRWGTMQLRSSRENSPSASDQPSDRRVSPTACSALGCVSDDPRSTGANSQWVSDRGSAGSGGSEGSRRDVAVTRPCRLAESPGCRRWSA